MKIRNILLKNEPATGEVVKTKGKDIGGTYKALNVGNTIGYEFEDGFIGVTHEAGKHVLANNEGSVIDNAQVSGKTNKVTNETVLSLRPLGKGSFVSQGLGKVIIKDGKAIDKKYEAVIAEAAKIEASKGRTSSSLTPEQKAKASKEKADQLRADLAISLK